MELRTSRVSTGLTALTVGIVIGAAASWALLFGKLDTAKPLVERIFDSLLPVLGIVCLAMAIIVPLGAWGIQRFLKGARGTIDEVVKEISAGAQAAAQKDAPRSAVHAERAVLAALAWYGPIAARRWIVRTALGLLVAFGGLVGTALLFRQTVLLVEQNRLLGGQTTKLSEQIDLLRDQNKKLDLQTVTAEAQRRAGLASELFSILQESAAQLKDKAASPTRPERLTAELTSRIVAFSRSASPYWTIVLDDKSHAPRLDDRARSPERGQLLAGLVLIGAFIPPLVDNGAQFSHADLREANLEEAILHRIDLEGADLRGVRMRKSDLSDARLNGADLGCINVAIGKREFGQCADLSYTKLTGAFFQGAKLNKTDLRSAHVGCLEERTITDGRRAAQGVDPSCTNFQGAEFGGPQLDDLYSDNDEMLTRAWQENLPLGWRFDGEKLRKSPEQR